MTHQVIRDERGAVMALVRVMLPVFLVLTALVIDVGNWFTMTGSFRTEPTQRFACRRRVRQNWQNLRPRRTTPRSSAVAAQKSRTPRGSTPATPTTADYSDLDPLCGVVPCYALQRRAITIQATPRRRHQLDNDYADDTDYTDDYDGTTRHRCEPGHPCFMHTVGRPRRSSHLAGPVDGRPRARDATRAALLGTPFSPDLPLALASRFAPPSAAHQLLAARGSGQSDHPSADSVLRRSALAHGLHGADLALSRMPRRSGRTPLGRGRCSGRFRDPTRPSEGDPIAFDRSEAPLPTIRLTAEAISSSSRGSKRVATFPK